ncbi:DNA polymerase III subunit epsilon [Candidatus Competibacter phosphatis]|uniref:DNA-directed DNA polymerase n=1 Tax=Candidatus Competibacter phosphatis TaxID=221280 RepID=A0ABX1TL22_9GAMM|nr:exonuclease domain-containing protein [Candidatus Competibacter phosphatis]NMQ20107.1 DNA polymerase III subunit epsilon [Candidatus Competibacter phosphatis]
MNENLKIALALIAFLALVAGLEAMAGYAFFHALEAEDQQRVLAILTSRAELLLELGVLRMAILGIAFGVAYQLYVKGPLTVAEGIRIMLKAHSGHRIEPAGPPEVRQLARAVNDLAEHSEGLARGLEAEIARATASLEEEKNRLAALMSELSQGVLVCNIEGRILLYNERARQVFGASANPRNGGSCALVGLGRSIFALVDRSLLTHALEGVQARLEKDQPDPNVQFVIGTRTGQLVRVQLAPVLTAGLPHAGQGAAIGGFVMTLENITRAFDLDTTRDMLLHSFTEGSRAALASIRAAVETLIHYPDCERAQHDCFIQIIDEETRKLSARLDRLTVDHADSLKTRWPLEEMLGLDVIATARRRIENRLGVPTHVEAADDSLWLRVDSYTLVQALASLAGRLRDGCGVGELCFHLARHGRIAELDLAWPGPALPQQALYDWEMAPMSAGGEDSPLTLRDVLERHGAEIVYMAGQNSQWSRFRFLLPMAKPVRHSHGISIRHGESRPEFYDFDLFHQAGQTPELDGLRLADLAFTVFDTETTGLDPAAGDEIIAIGAVRIVNNRLLRNETYEQLVDPRRPIASMSQTVHGISHDMLRGQPVIDEVLPQFYEYCADTVLVGHNAAFDLRFLQMKEARTGLRFTQPVLDTLLLSEVLHPNQESHALEAVAGRLGVTVVARHTALGDALVTGEIFLRMIPLLAAHGIHTLRDAREAAEKIHVKVEY